MLAIQVAAGIVLAYVVIVNQRVILASGKLLLGVLATVATFALLGWLLSTTAMTVGGYIPAKFWRKLMTLVGLVPVFILALTAAMGMLALGGIVAGRTPEAVWRGVTKFSEQKHKSATGKKSGEDAGCLLLLGLMIVTGVVNLGLSFPLWDNTPLGRWYSEVDLYGRTHGWDDGLSILFAVTLWNWPWVPVGIYHLVKRLRGPRGSDHMD